METIIQKASGDRWIWLVAILLSVFSILAVYSSTGTLAYRSANDGFTFSYLFRHGSVIVTGLVLMYIAHLINHRYYYRIAQVLLYVSIPLLLYTQIGRGSVRERVCTSV